MNNDQIYDNNHSIIKAILEKQHWFIEYLKYTENFKKFKHPYETFDIKLDSGLYTTVKYYKDTRTFQLGLFNYGLEELFPDFAL